MNRGLNVMPLELISIDSIKAFTIATTTVGPPYVGYLQMRLK